MKKRGESQEATASGCKNILIPLFAQLLKWNRERKKEGIFSPFYTRLFICLFFLKSGSSSSFILSLPGSLLEGSRSSSSLLGENWCQMKLWMEWSARARGSRIDSHYLPFLVYFFLPLPLQNVAKVVLQRKRLRKKSFLRAPIKPFLQWKDWVVSLH